MGSVSNDEWGRCLHCSTGVSPSYVRSNIPCIISVRLDMSNGKNVCFEMTFVKTTMELFGYVLE